MSFGKNPHVAKAQAAEQKAGEATDAMAREAAWREAAHQWERAAQREKFDKRIAEYQRNATVAREAADSPSELTIDPAAIVAIAPFKRTELN